MERLPQSDSEDPTRARPAVPRFAALLLIPALLLFALLLVRPEPSKLREGVPVEASALWKRGAPPGGPGKAPRKPKVRKPKKPQPQEPPMGGSSESGSEPPAEPTEVEVTWNTISGKPIPFKHKPRVRREWRTLSLEMKNKVARAFWQVKTVKTLEGRKIYGKHFNNHDDMLILHSCATTDPRCDEGHFGPQFMTFHRALLLKYELSLLSVDPTIEAMPYWNMAYDAKDGKYRHDPEKYIFTNNYFGNYTGTGANYMVIDGLFANFPVTEWTSERFGNKSYMAKDNKCIREEWFKGTKPSVCDRCCVTHCSDCRDTSPDVYTTRLRLHDDCSPYVARWPMDPDALGPLGGTYDLVYSEEDFAACHDVKVVRSWMEWQDCIEMSTFMCGHRFGIVSGQPGFETVFKKRVLPD
ncbi:unnamed protein product [Durusdinium trenchii]|uniref:Tyrosinase copper-binding domain-containing protein n=1 Tax=Durusdinium trenchii TaxID=1381693 RepID=A0ABP0S7N3_9DINO